jgi:hypothetical protein
MKRIFSTQVAQGALLEGCAFQGVCFCVHENTALFRDTAGQIVMTDVPDIAPDHRYQVEFNELCSVVSASTPIVGLAGGIKITALRNQTFREGESLNTVSLEACRNMPRGQPFDVHSNYTLVNTNGKGLKLHLWNESGFLTLMMWTRPIKLPPTGRIFITNVVIRDSKCPQADFEIHADLNEYSRHFIFNDTVQDMPSFPGRLDVTTQHVISDTCLLPQTATIGSVVTVMHAQLFNMKECSFTDRFKNEQRKFWTYEFRVGKNPNTLNLSCWDTQFCFPTAITTGAHCTIVGLKLVMLKSRMQYSTTAVSVFFWSKPVATLGLTSQSSIIQTALAVPALEELEEVDDELTQPPCKPFQNPSRQRDELEPLDVATKIRRTETPQSTPMLTPSASTPSEKPTPTKVSPSLSPATKLDLLAL